MMTLRRIAVLSTMILLVIAVLSCSEKQSASEASLSDAQELLGKMDYAGAIQIAESKVQDDSTDSEVLAFLLRAHYFAGDTTAYRGLRSDLEAKDAPSAKLALGHFYFYIGEFDSAANKFSLASSYSGYEDVANHVEKARKGRLAETWADSAFQSLMQSQFLLAINRYNRADSLWQQVTHDNLRARALSYRAFAFMRASDILNAEKNITKSYEISQKTGDRWLLARILNIWGNIKDYTAKYREAIEKYEQAKEFAQAINDRRFVLTVAGNIATTQEKTGEIREARATYLEILSFADILSKRNHNTTLHNLGHMSLVLGYYDEAQDYYEKSILFAKERGERLLEAASTSGLGDVFYFRGQFEEAEEHKKQSIHIHREIGNMRDVSGGLRSLSEIYSYMGRYDEGLKAAQNAQSIADSLGIKDISLKAKSNIAMIYQAQKDYRSAKAIHEDVLPLAKELEYFDLVHATITLLARCYIETKTLPASTNEWEQLIAYAEKQGLPYTAESTRLVLALILSEKGMENQAIALLDMVIDASQSNGDLRLFADAFLSKGSVYEKMGRIDQASLAYERALVTHEQIANAFGSSFSRAAYFDELREHTEKQVLWAYTLKEYHDVFKFAEKAKARTFLGLLSQREVQFSARDNDQFLKKGLRLRSELSRRYSQLAQNISSGESGARSSVREHTSKQFEQAQAAYSEFLHEVERDRPMVGSVLSSAVVSLEDALPQIPQDALLLQYVVLDDRILICAARPGNPLQVFSVSYSRAVLRSHVRRFREAVRLKQQNWKEQASRLGGALLDSIQTAGLFDDVNSVIVLADDVLYRLPFQTLMLDGAVLASQFVVVNYPSASVMKYVAMQRPAQMRKEILAIAYPKSPRGTLRYVVPEAQAIEALWNAPVRVITDEHATKDTLRQLAERVDIIHLAMHGIPSPESPLLFALQFAPKNEVDDGRFFVHDAFSFAVDSALVVLSACESGLEAEYRAGISAGGEVVGLVRGFLFAGASAVVSTLWNVNDESSLTFMREFYTELQKTHDAAVAVQYAQKALIAHPKYNHPYYWGPYIATGK